MTTAEEVIERKLNECIDAAQEVADELTQEELDQVASLSPRGFAANLITYLWKKGY